ncbi:flavin reductase family protein [Bradyrhizobium sp. 2TAF24]|uniref:flavin reductase family protein n=1 Tax=Bradyrhizobium sp. 2TAF24 TaxID=3233011 RepID=UPI003F8DC0C4
MNSLVRIVQTDLDVSAASFRNAMRQLAGGVSVITVGRDQDISGMTVTSVTSLSAEPPSLLVCINRSSSSWPLFEKYGAFAVNILHADQQHIADRFTGRGGATGAARFEGAQWSTLATGVPVLADGLAALDCRIEEVIHRHSHAIVIGRVEAVRVAGKTAALTYWQGEYVAIDRDEDAVRLAAVSLPVGTYAKP